MALLDQLAQEQALSGLLAQQPSGPPQFHRVQDIVPRVALGPVGPRRGLPVVQAPTPPMPELMAPSPAPAGDPEPPALAGAHAGPGGTLKPLPAAATQPLPAAATQPLPAAATQPLPAAATQPQQTQPSFMHRLRQQVLSPLLGTQLGFGGASF